MEICLWVKWNSVLAQNILPGVGEGGGVKQENLTQLFLFEYHDLLHSALSANTLRFIVTVTIY